MVQLLKLKEYVRYEPALPLLVTHSTDVHKCVYQKLCTRTVITAIFILGLNGKQSKCPSTE